MTAAFVAVALAVLTAALLLEEWSWKRKHGPQVEAACPPVRGRCLCCPNAPIVDDIFTHSRLAHRSRVVAPEDSGRWSA